jgi:flagellar basal-body rod modification protein FlgD
MSTINSTEPVDFLTGERTGAKTVRNPKSELKVEDFINMMVTQLQNQDPLEPAKNDQLLAQMSQIGQLQSSQTLQDSLKSLVTQNNLGSAGNFIGKVVKGPDTLSGQETFGKVLSVNVVKGEVKLQLDTGGEIELGKVSDVMGEQSLIGKYVQGGDGEDAFKGVVQSVRDDEGRLMLTLRDGSEVPLAEVTNMREATADDLNGTKTQTVAAG